VYKALSELEDIGVAQRGDGGYRLTLLGRLLFEQYRQFQRRLDDICAPGTLLAILPPDMDVPFGLVEGAETFLSERHAPNKPIREIERVVTSASEIKGIGPVVLPRYVELFTDQFTSDELVGEMLFERPVVDHLRTDYRDDLTAAFESDNVELWATDTTLPYGLVVVEAPDPKIIFVVYDSAGEIKGILVNDTTGAVEWGRDQWQRYKATAAERIE